MAQKRMIDKKISVSEQVADLRLEAQLIFSWSIPHADDVGLLPYSLRSLKALIVPMQDWTLDQFNGYWKDITSKGLIVEFEYESRKFWRVAKFFKFQMLRKDIQPWTILQVKLSEKARESWTMLFEIMGVDEATMETERDEDVTPTLRPRNEPSTEDKRSKEKIREEKKYMLEMFETFYSKYPNKKAKPKALQSFIKLNPSEKLFTEIMAGLEKQIASTQWKKDNGQFIPHPTTWLNQERWNDEVVVSTGNKTDKF